MLRRASHRLQGNASASSPSHSARRAALRAPASSAATDEASAAPGCCRACRAPSATLPSSAAADASGSSRGKGRRDAARIDLRWTSNLSESFRPRRGPLDERIRTVLRLPVSHAGGPQLARPISTLSPRAGSSTLPFSFFSSSTPPVIALRPFASVQSHSSYATHSASADKTTSRLTRFVPELVTPPAIYLGTEFDDLCWALRDGDGKRAWNIFTDLESRTTRPIPRELIASTWTLLAQQPERDIAEEIQGTCQRLLHLSRAAADADFHDLGYYDQQTLANTTRQCVYRLTHLLLVNAERIVSYAAQHGGARSPDKRQAVENLCQAVQQLDSCARGKARAPHLEGSEAAIEAELELRERLALSLVRLRRLDLATGQLIALVDLAAKTERSSWLESVPFEEALAAATRAVTTAPNRKNRHLPSPVDDRQASSLSSEVDSLLRILRTTLAADVAPSKSSLLQALRSLRNPTLIDLLPFAAVQTGQSSSAIDSSSAPQFVPRWHPWQNDTDGPTLPVDLLASFSDLVALVLAERGNIAPALHIIESRAGTAAPSRVSDDSVNGAALGRRQQPPGQHKEGLVEPDSELFEVVMSILTRRIRKVGRLSSQLSKDTYPSMLNEIRVLLRVYSFARRTNLPTETLASLHHKMARSLSALARISLVNIGNCEVGHRPRDRKRSQLASKNEAAGSKELLQGYLRRVTTSILSQDPTLRNGSLDHSSHVSLMGLHMKVRDYSFAKRLYQLYRVREPEVNLWSLETQSGSLRRSAVDPVAAPDRPSFGWFFIESLGASAKPHFAARLYLDWLGSGNELSANLVGLFVAALLKAGLNSVSERLVRDLHEQRAEIPAFLARTFADKFSTAGYPEAGVEMALSLARAWRAQQAKSQDAQDGVDQPSGIDEIINPGRDWLTSVLEIHSIALDKSSRANLGWTPERRAGIFKLFDEFRLALGHFLRQKEQQRAGSSPIDETAMSIRYTREAYNAAIRTHLGHHGDFHESADPFEDEAHHLERSRKAELDTMALDVSRQQIHRLVGEMKDMAVEPDSATWGMLVLSDLATIDGRYPTKSQLLRAVRTFKQSTTASYLAEGPLQLDPSAEDGGSVAGSWSTAVSPSRKRQHKTERKDVRLRSGIAGRLIISLARAGEHKLAHSVYSIWKTRQAEATSGKAWDRGVEGARVYLLAAEGRGDDWRKALAKLTQSGYQAKTHFVKRLESLELAAVAAAAAKTGAPKGGPSHS